MKALALLIVATVALFACESSEPGPIDAFVGGGGGCSFGFVEEISEPPPAELLDLVRACEADAAQCEPLCRKIFEDRGHANDFLDSCMVEHAATGHAVTIKYHLLCAD